MKNNEKTGYMAKKMKRYFWETFNVFYALSVHYAIPVRETLNGNK